MHNPSEASNDHRNDLPHREPASHAAPGTAGSPRPMADREVPLPGTMGASMTATHQWLDGQLSEHDARRANAKQVDLWNRIDEEIVRRRRMTTPAGMVEQIMSALPARDMAVDPQMASE